MKDKALDALASEIISRLQGQVVIHRYDAYSTRSIYLKFDYGVANSLRISDHPGKHHLKYRYNLISGQAGTPSYTVMRGEFPMKFYPPEEIDRLAADILAAKQAKIAQYNSYDAVLNKVASEIDRSTGFWRGAREVAQGPLAGNAPVQVTVPSTQDTGNPHLKCAACAEPTKKAVGFWDGRDPATGRMTGGRIFSCANLDCPYAEQPDPDMKIICETVNSRNGIDAAAMKALLRTKGLILHDAAKLAGTTPAQLSAWLNCRQPFDPDAYAMLMSAACAMPDRNIMNPGDTERRP